MRERACGGRLAFEVTDDISVGTGGRGKGSITATGTAAWHCTASGVIRSCTVPCSRGVLELACGPAEIRQQEAGHKETGTRCNWN